MLQNSCFLLREDFHSHQTPKKKRDQETEAPSKFDSSVKIDSPGSGKSRVYLKPFTFRGPKVTISSANNNKQRRRISQHIQYQ